MIGQRELDCSPVDPKKLIAELQSSLALSNQERDTARAKLTVVARDVSGGDQYMLCLLTMDRSGGRDSGRGFAECGKRGAGGTTCHSQQWMIGGVDSELSK